MTNSPSDCVFSREMLQPLVGFSNKQRVTLVGNVLAEPCGRNNVWRLHTTGHTVHYAKVLRGKAEYERELCGLRLGEELAAKCHRFMAAPIVYADNVDCVIVTRQLPGSSLGQVFKIAYRIDKNPLRKNAARAKVRRAVALILDWITSFQELKTDGRVLLYDHSLAEIRRRINSKLTSVINGKTLRQHLNVELVSEPKMCEERHVLTFGDVTLGNFFFDGLRIGAIDFEDVGIGPSIRDHICLRIELVRAFERFHYSSDPDLLSLFPRTPDCQSSLIELELYLARFEQLVASRKLTDYWAISNMRKRIVELYDCCS